MHALQREPTRWPTEGDSRTDRMEWVRGEGHDFPSKACSTPGLTQRDGATLIVDEGLPDGRRATSPQKYEWCPCSLGWPASGW